MASVTNTDTVPTETRPESKDGLKVYDRVLATVSAIGLIAGGGWSVYQYNASRARENDIKARELDLALFRERRDTYYAISDAASDIAAARNREQVIERSREFLKLYNGRAHLLAELDDDVRQSKIAFKKLLHEYLDGQDKESTESPFAYFNAAAYQLTKSCSKHLDPRELDPIQTRNRK